MSAFGWYIKYIIAYYFLRNFSYLRAISVMENTE